MREIIFATGNENKMREIREIFEGLPFVIHSLKEAGLVSDPEENGATFAENAFIKAEVVHALRPDAIVMSDDSGLSVDYLNGEPGVFSARWLGRDTSYTEKNAELIRRLEGVEGDARSARFTAAIACILPDGTLLIPGRETVLEQNMQIHLVCAEKDAERISELIGELIEVGHEEKIESEQYVSRRLVVTRPEINGKSFAQLHVSSLYNVNVTRVTRHGMDLFAARDLRLQVGDRILVTGTEKNIERFKDVVGAQVKHLDHPNVGAIFFGILIGIIVGQIPIPIPGITVPVKLGLAGGPLVVAILIGAVGYRYKINTYVSTSANLLLREVGLVLFLSSVGIQAGASFWNTITQGDGVHYVWMGFLITTVPILLVGVFARLKMKLNYFTLMGLIAGSNTDPPALAFANATAGNNAPAVGYSTVYPLAMFMRILLAQLVLSVFLG